MPRSGRKRKLNLHQENEILEKIEKEPFTSAAEMARSFQVSRTTISNRLRENDIKCYISARQTKLTEDNRIIRYAYFDSFRQKYSQNQIDKIIFSDEKTFQSDVVRQNLVYRPPNSRYQEQYLSEDNLSGRISASYWGAISVEGPVTDIVRIYGHYNKEKYLETLKVHLVPAMKRLGDRIFMHDNSPVHTAQAVSDFLSKQSFTTMMWPPYSPDGNPIENVWAHMTKDWPAMENRTQQALDRIIRERWEQLRHEPGLNNISEMNYFNI